MERLPDSLFDVLQGVADDVGTAFSSASDIEKTIWFATSLEPSPPSQNDLKRICAAARDSYVGHLNAHFSQRHNLSHFKGESSRSCAKHWQAACRIRTGGSYIRHVHLRLGHATFPHELSLNISAVAGCGELLPGACAQKF